MVLASEILERAFAAGIRPDPRLSVSAWAAKNRVLSARESSEPGPWRNARAPFLCEPMDCLGDSSDVEEVSIVKGAQTGGTEILLNWIGYTIDQSPCSFLYALPTIDLARTVSRSRIDSMIDESPRVRARISSKRTKDETNSALEKYFEGGLLRMIGANSPSGMRSMPAQRIALDDFDGFPDEVGDEGDPGKLIEKRGARARRRKILRISTPTVEGRSKIQAAYLEGDQSRWFVPCPECGHMQTIEWPRLIFDEANPAGVVHACEACAVGSPEHAWKKLFDRGVWLAKFPERSHRHRSFSIPALLSPLGTFSWKDAVSEFLKCYPLVDGVRTKSADPAQLKAWVNTVLGQTWKERGDAPDWNRLWDRREPYAVGTVPAGGLVLTAGIDVQQDRVAVEVVAWGERLESWSVIYREIPGEPEKQSTWDEVARFVGQPWKHASGVDLRVRAVGVDTGYATQEVYAFVRRNGVGTYFALKGTDSAYALVEIPKAVDVAVGGKKLRRGLKVWQVGGPVAKSELYGFLRHDSPKNDEPAPKGFCHFPTGYGEEFFRQLTAEHVVVHVRHGRRHYVWELIPGRRNEVLDCRCYARAAAAIAGIDHWTEEDWAGLRDRVTLPLIPTTTTRKTRKKHSGYLDRFLDR